MGMNDDDFVRRVLEGGVEGEYQRDQRNGLIMEKERIGG